MTKTLRGEVLAGLDGCPGGWIGVIERPGQALSAQVFAHIGQVMQAVGPAGRIGIDIPIGLPESGPRECEREARRRLGVPRMASVFPVPPRGCLVAASYEEACAIRERIEGKRMSRQAFGILPKIREVDEYLTGHPDVAERVTEMHPEVSFAVWNGGQAMVHNKKKPAGKAERRTQIEKVWPAQLERLRESLRGEKYALDDLHDAFAMLWSVRRWAAGEAETLGDGVRDARGLLMRMVV